MTRVLAALNVPRRIPEILVYAQSVAVAMTGNPAFPSPVPPLATFEGDIAALEASHVRTLTRAVGTASERNSKLATVQSDLGSLRAYVQDVANASPGQAAVVIASAAMSVKRSSGHAKADFEANQGPVSGTARLVAKAPRVRTSYDWQQSTDGIAWVDLERTMRADADVVGLAAGTRYLFRYRTLTKDGIGDWSRTVSLLVG
jgi:hypothetical protein